MHGMILFAAVATEAPVFSLDSQTLISIGIQLLNGIILAVALGYILYKPVKQFMQKRTDRIQSRIDEADAKMTKANELIAEYNEKLREIHKERNEILEAARHKAADESRIIIEEAKQEADEIMKRSLDSIMEDKKRFEEETRLHIIELASLIAQKYIDKNIDSEAQDRLFEEAIEKLEGYQWQN